MTQVVSNIDDVRERIMQLESAAVFDQTAWWQVLADLSAAGRVAGLEDAKRRMETAKENQYFVGVDVASGADQTVISVSVETVAGEWRHQDWLHSSEGLPDFEEADRRNHLDAGDRWCGICEDWIGKHELRRWSGDDQLHLLCPGCGADMVQPVSLEA
jgi:hypothetical protein